MSDDFAGIARDLKLPLDQIRQTVELLDAGNTIPFIARFRKDQTGGLDPEQVLAIKQRVTQLRALEERKTFVLKSIESQGQLTESLAGEIKSAPNSRRVEDLYLPFKAKKQSLALTARQQGLEPLAEDIIAGQKPESELASIALEFVRVDRGLASVDDVMIGVGHLIAERFSERSDVRRELRRLIWTTGALNCKSAKPQETNTPPAEKRETPPAATTDSHESGAQSQTHDAAPADSPGGLSEHPIPQESPAAVDSAPIHLADDNAVEIGVATHGLEAAPFAKNAELASHEAPSPSGTSDSSTPLPVEIHPPSALESSSGAESEIPSADSLPSAAPAAGSLELSGESSDPEHDLNRSEHSSEKHLAAGLPPSEKKTDRKKSPANPFSDYEDFTESLKKIPNHRILAINRGERAGLLKAKVKVDLAALEAKVLELLVPSEHPLRTFLAQCAQDALNRLIFPSLEREVRRELTENAEQHALRVFSENLKALLLQPPIRGKRILAIDPGYKSGCAVAILDEQGTVVQTEKLFVVGNQARREENRNKLAQLVRDHQVDLIAIGNGTACREAEQLVSDSIKQVQPERTTRYVIVNEAGTSTYSTSDIGKEELPQLSVGARCAVSIGRRLLDPLSELVKIPPANLGVGLYQHDIKAKHLAESLDEVVEACVNHVGVSVNTASASLLRYVAGLNQLTARRLLEFRQEKPFTNRQQLREVSGIGDATFVQAAGFLRIFGGDQPLDETAIHPESYPLVEKILAKVAWTLDDWVAQRKPPMIPAPAETTASAEPAPVSETRQPHPLSRLQPGELARDFGTGELLMKDLLDALQRPSHDPRTKNLGPVFRSGIIKLEDLQPQLQLESQIVNVVDFGVFVDVGLGYSCLVHVSELSRGFVRDLYQQFAVGDVLTTWVKEVDAARRRVKLTAIPPGTKKFERPQRTARPARGERRDRQSNATAATAQPGTAPPVGASPNAPARNAPPRSRPFGKDRFPQKTGQGNQGFRGNQTFRGKRREPGKFEKRPRIDRPSRPKPIKPITDEMLSGKKAMRSFSDLAQFFEKKTKPDTDDAPQAE